MNYQGLIQDIQNNKEKWRNFSENEDLFTSGIDEYWDGKFDLFDKLILVKIFQQKQVLSSIRKYIK